MQLDQNSLHEALFECEEKTLEFARKGTIFNLESSEKKYIYS